MAEVDWKRCRTVLAADHMLRWHIHVLDERLGDQHPRHRDTGECDQHRLHRRLPRVELSGTMQPQGKDDNDESCGYCKPRERARQT